MNADLLKICEKLVNPRYQSPIFGTEQTAGRLLCRFRQEIVQMWAHHVLDGAWGYVPANLPYSLWLFSERRGEKYSAGIVLTDICTSLYNLASVNYFYCPCLPDSIHFCDLCCGFGIRGQR